MAASRTNIMAERKPYWQLLRDPRWQRKRLEIMQRDKFMCCDCGAKESTLNVHHAYYRKGADPWDYPSFMLRTLCEFCHNERHIKTNELLTMIGQQSLHELECVVGYMKGMMRDEGIGGPPIETYSEAIGFAHYWKMDHKDVWAKAKADMEECTREPCDELP